MTADEVRKALRARYGDNRRYAIAEEVGLTTGGGCRRLDMIVMDCYHSNGFRIDGFEIKISKEDLRRELSDPEKHVAFFDVVDFYTLAIPENIRLSIDESIIPPKWGIMIVYIDVNGKLSTRYKRKPLALKDESPRDRKIPRGFLASITRAIQEYQPSAAELKREYNRGFADGKIRAENRRDYLAERVRRDAKMLEDYDKLRNRLSLYGHTIEEVVDEFEAFRKMDTYWVKSSIAETIKRLSAMNDMLCGKKEDEDE